MGKFSLLRGRPTSLRLVEYVPQRRLLQTRLGKPTNVWIGIIAGELGELAFNLMGDFQISLPVRQLQRSR